MRYIILVAMNLPIMFIALIDFITRYKLKRIEKNRFRRQLIVWVILLIALIGSFPLYNILKGKLVLDSSELSLFDIFQTSAIIFLIYVVNSQSQKAERTEKILRDLHQELSITLSGQLKK